MRSRSFRRLNRAFSVLRRTKSGTAVVNESSEERDNLRNSSVPPEGWPGSGCVCLFVLVPGCVLFVCACVCMGVCVCVCVCVYRSGFFFLSVHSYLHSHPTRQWSFLGKDHFLTKCWLRCYTQRMWTHFSPQVFIASHKYLVMM